VTDAAAPVRIPTKPVTDSDLNPAICSDLISAFEISSSCQ
jgi:hypothetical protein